MVDFAPQPKKDRRMLEEALRKAFRADPVETALVGWTSMGLYEMQRKRERRPPDRKPRMSCPICKKPTNDARHRPFCSRRCADLDLGRWMNGAYAIPTTDADNDDRPPGSSGVEQWIENPRVGGSIPPRRVNGPVAIMPNQCSGLGKNFSPGKRLCESERLAFDGHGLNDGK